MKIETIDQLTKVKEKGLSKLLPDKICIGIGMGTCGIGNGSYEIYQAFEQSLKKYKLSALLKPLGCFGFCSQEPLMNVRIPGMPLVIFNKISLKSVDTILKGLLKGSIDVNKTLCKIEKWDHITEQINYGKGYEKLPSWKEIPFFELQKKIVLRNAGLINPDDIEEYIGVGGYSAFSKALLYQTPEQIIDEVKSAKLRGRGGAGYPTGKKWEILRQAPGDKKFIICNADEGDPGAFMNRNELESDPHMILEGILIAGYATGASQGIIYIRAEYPLAVKRLKKAIEQAKQYGLLGKNIFGTNFSFDILLVEGAGAFVCGEETALIASIEGKPGRPIPRPPFPAQRGYLNKPTNINNVETLCNIPVIVSKGAKWFCKTGTQNSPGTKVFSLVGKIKNTGLVELPLGETIQRVVYNIGGGTGTRRKVKAIQSGGPSGGCIPARLFNSPIDYESLTSLNAIMGSGGMVVMDEDNCMVDVAKYFTQFTTSESCGKCTPCREGLSQALNFLTLISRGEAQVKDLKILEDLCYVIKDSALCGLGQTAPNPILTTLKYFRNEYEEHIIDKRCDASVCDHLFLSPCENTCPLHMNIPGFLELFNEERLTDAFELIYRENPLPASSGRICHFHCKLRCRREDVDEPVSQGEVHRFIADKVYSEKKYSKIINKLIAEKFPETGKKISIVGAGPCGLTAAFYLSRLGHDVTIYEANKKPGGVLYYGIPQYRLPKNVLQREIDFIKKFGVKFVFNKKIDSKSLQFLKKKSDIVFIATGAYKSMPLGIKGENLSGVISGVNFLKDIASGKKVTTGNNIMIIGAGNVAIDAARTAHRLGKKVTIVYRREKSDMPANKQEIEEAQREGIQFKFLLAPKEIVGDVNGHVKAIKCQKIIPGDYDLSGRRRPISADEIVDIECDMVMSAIGEKVDSDFIQKNGISLNDNGTVNVDPFTFMTNDNIIYAGGDLVMGPSTAVEAMAHGRRAAQIIDNNNLNNSTKWENLFREFSYKRTPVSKTSSKGQQKGKILANNMRKNNFKEICLGLTESQVIIETKRCLRCDIKGK